MHVRNPGGGLEELAEVELGDGGAAEPLRVEGDVERGDLREVVAHEGLPRGAVQRRRPTFFDTLMGARTPRVRAEDAIARLLQSTTGAKFLYFWPGGR